MFHEDEDNELSKTATDEPLNDKTFTQSSSNSQQLEQEHQNENLNGHINNDSEDHNVYGINERVDEKSELSLEEQHQAISTADEIVQSTNNTSKPNFSANILPFEISWIFREIRSYMAPLYSKIGDNGRVWVSGLIDKNTGKVISRNFGRLNQQQQGQNPQNEDNGIDSPNRDDVDEL